MDVVIERFWGLEFSPFSRAQSQLVVRPEIGSLSTDHTATLFPWIEQVRDVARSGVPQATIAIVSILWLGASLIFGRRHIPPSPSKTSYVKWPYETVSQALRVSALAFLVRAYLQDEVHLLNVVVVGYVFVLGVARLSYCDLWWRHAALTQVNLVLIGMTLTLAAAQFTPCLQVDTHCAKGIGAVGAVSSLAGALMVAAVTPREWIPPQLKEDIPGLVMPTEPAAEERTSWLNYYCTYEWLSPMIWKGARGVLNMSGIPTIAWYDEPLYLLHNIQQARKKAQKSTMLTIFRYQWRELSLMMMWTSVGFASENFAAFAMFKLLDYIAFPDDAKYRPWVWLTLLFAGPMMRSILFQMYVFTSTRLLVRVKSALTQELYHRALSSMELEDDPFKRDVGDKDAKAKAKEAQANTTKTTSAGRLANLMAADVEAVFKGRDIIMISFGVPIGTIVSLIGLYKILGWASIVGTIVLLGAAPISGWLSRLMYFTQLRVRKSQDARISLVTEYLASIRAIKYFAWEKPITNKIVSARSAEQKGLWTIVVLSTIINQVAQGIPFISLLVMFGLYVGVAKQPLESSTAFTTVFLVKNIRRNIMMASGMSRNAANMFVAFGRLDKYFNSTVPLTEYPVGPLRIKNAYFRRNKKATFRLEDISLDFVEGGLNVITGQSGSGKTTLLLAILGETYLEGGAVTAPGDIAYASQTAWLQNDTIQNNILFGSPMDRARYNRVIYSCCLNQDLRDLANGDQTSVGESGTSLSGGQKARVALARALYAPSSLVLMDDIFSALDAKTSASVWKRCFCKDMLKGRTVILVTQVPWISSQADYAILLERGVVLSAEPNIGVVRRPITIAEVLGGDGDDDDQGETDTPAEPELASSEDPLNKTTKVANEVPKKDIVDQEAKASGKVGRLTFLQYMSYFGNPLFAATCLFGLFLSNIFFFGGSYWLSFWVEAYESSDYVNVAWYMGIYAAFAFLELSSFGASVIMFEWGAWRAARKLHNDFIRAIMGVSLSWFKVIPVGRITNRFSADMASIDGALSNQLRTMIDAAMMVFFRIASISSIMPVFMIPALFVCAFGVVIGELYTRTAVVVKRLASSSQSPVFSQFADTLAGLSVIRARAGKSQAFREELAAKLRIWSAAAEANYNCNRWVAVRVDFVTSLVSLCAGLIAVSKVGLVSAGLVGFSLSNANGLNQTILMLVRSMNDLEVEIQSFHRVKEYVKLEPEDKDDKVYPSEGEFADDEAHVIPHNWPSTGDIEFRNVTIRYDPDGPNILTDVNLKFKAGERVAVVGRTGSGKSTLVLSLLRFTHIVSGQILYDGIDITKVPRSRLREGLTIIPQEAVLFNGTVESNLDPTGLVPQERLEGALVNCRGIASFSGSDVSDDEHGTSQGISLSTDVDARGENFSHGQRQVLSLCRALIRESKLMLLDEATASMDYETDKGIQAVLRQELEAAGGDRTLVTIAHRLRTIIDYDSVVVMSAGRVVENGSPRDLYHAKGLFYDMVYHSGEMDDLQSFLEDDMSTTSGSTTQVE